MKINTDLVKGKKYSSAVKPNTLKHSQEYRVLATLRYLYPSKFDTMITGEAPDLQDSASSTGIEVTAAVKEDDMKYFLLDESKVYYRKVPELSVARFLFALKLNLLSKRVKT